MQRGDGGEAGRVEQREQHEAVGLHPVELLAERAAERGAAQAVDHRERADHDLLGDEAEDQRDGELLG